MANELAILPQEFVFQMFGVYDPGTPNLERVVLRANLEVGLSSYFLVTGWQLTPDRALPLNADSFWFGKTSVLAGTWVVVYTGRGQQTFTTLGIEPCLVLHWNKPAVLFSVPQAIPVLIRADSVAIGRRTLVDRCASMAAFAARSEGARRPAGATRRTPPAHDRMREGSEGDRHARRARPRSRSGAPATVAGNHPV